MLYNNIQCLCKNKGITIKELEEATGIGNGVIGKWKNKIKSPRISLVVKVANYFRVPIDYLLQDHEKTA